MDNRIYELGGYKIEQRADGMFNATSLVERWNESNRVKKRLDMFMRTSEATDAVVECRVSGEEPADRVREPFVKGRPKETIWYNAKLLVPLARWLDNALGTKAVYVAAAILITSVIGGSVDERTDRLKEIVSGYNGDYGRVEKGINCIVDKESKNDIDRILNTDRVLTRLIGEVEIGVIKDYDGLIKRLGDMYNKKK